MTAAFGDLLHRSGIPVTPERSARFTEAVLIAQPGDVEQVYWLGRVTLLSSQSQIPVFNMVFDQAFRGILDVTEEIVGTPQPPAAGTPSGERIRQEDRSGPESDSVAPITSATPGAAAEGGIDTDDTSMLAAASRVERLGHRDFSLCTPEELILLRRLVEQLPVVPPLRKGQRSRRHRAGDRLDVRATLRRAHRTGGDPVRRVRRRRTMRPRRVVLIADVSGSMEPYARVYLQIGRAHV